MSTRATLILIAVFSGLVAAYWITGRLERDSVKQAAQAKKLFDFAAEDVTSLSIAREGEDLVEALRNDDGLWSIAAPHSHIPPNAPLWDAMTEVFASLTNERDIDADPDTPADYELDTPGLSVIAGTKQGQLIQVAFGALDPTQVNRYARIGDGQVFLTPAAAFHALNRGLRDLRDRRLLTHVGEGIVKMDVKRRETQGLEEIEDPRLADRARGIDESYALGNDGLWRMTLPVQAQSRQDKIKALVSYLEFATGRGYIDAPRNLSDYGLAPPFAEVTAHNPSGDAQALLLGWPSGPTDNTGVFVKRNDNPSVFIVDAHLLTLLPAGPGDFREKRLFTREAKRLKTIRYEDARSEMLLENEPEAGWQLVEPSSDDTDQLAVSMYIAMLKRVEGISFLEGGEAPPLDSPRLTLEFTFTDDTPPSAIHIGALVPSSNPIEFYARQAIGAATTISFESLSMLQAAPFDFRVKTLFPLQKDDLREIDLVLEDRRYVFRYSDSVWRLIEPRGARLETQTDVHSLIETFMMSKAKGLAEPPPSDGVLGRNEPILIVTFQILDGVAAGTTRTFGPVSVGNRVTNNSRRRFLWVEGKEPIYLIDQALIDGVRDALLGVVYPSSP